MEHDQVIPPETAATIRTTPVVQASGRMRYAATDVPDMWRVALTLLLSIAVPLYLVASTDEVGRSLGWVVSIPIIIWSGWRVSTAIASGTESYGPLMFWIFNYIFLGLAPLVQIRTGLLPTTTTNVLPEFDERAMLVVLAGLVALELAGKVASGRPPRVDRRGRALFRVSAPVVTIFCSIGLLAAWAYIARVGFSNVTGSRAIHTAARGLLWPDPAVAEIVYAVAFIPLLVAAHLLLLARLRNDVVSAPSTRRVLLLLVLATLAVVINPFGSARFIFGAVWLSVLAQMRIARTAGARRLFSLAIALGFLFVFPIADKFSRSNASGKTFRALEVFQGNGDYDAFAQTNNALNMTAHDGLSYGRQLLGVIFFWVPRSLWSGKPTDTGIEISRFMGYSFTNLSAPFVSELYVNGGLLLVLLGFGGLGYWMRRPVGHSGPAGSAATCIVAGVLPFYSPILLRGSLLQATGFAALFALCLLVLRWAARPVKDREMSDERSFG